MTGRVCGGCIRDGRLDLHGPALLYSGKAAGENDTDIFYVYVTPGVCGQGDVGMAIERYCANSILQALAGEIPDGRVNDIVR